MIIGKTLIKEDSRIVLHRGRLIAFEEDEDMNEKLEEAKKQIDDEIEQEVRDIIQKVMVEKCMIF